MLLPVTTLTIYYQLGLLLQVSGTCYDVIIFDVISNECRRYVIIIVVAVVVVSGFVVNFLYDCSVAETSQQDHTHHHQQQHLHVAYGMILGGATDVTYVAIF